MKMVLIANYPEAEDESRHQTLEYAVINTIIPENETSPLAEG